MVDTVVEPDLMGRWEWASFQGMDDSSLEIADPSLYTLEIRSDGVSVRADCNRGTGGYELDGSSLTFTPLAITQMACPSESLADRYLSHLSYVRSWIVEDGDLYLSLFADGGIMRFRAVGGPDFDDLIGMRAQNIDSEMRARGYEDSGRGHKTEDTSYVNWWNGSRSHCVSVATRDGRVAEIETVAAESCQ